MKSETGHASWRELLSKAVDLGIGAVLLTKEAAQKAVDELIAKGDMTKEEGKHLLERMMERGKEQKERLEKLIAETVESAIEKADLARGSELREARAGLAEVQKRLDRLEMEKISRRPSQEPPS